METTKKGAARSPLLLDAEELVSRLGAGAQNQVLLALGGEITSTGAAIAELDGAHAHLALEVMGKDGWWSALLVVPIDACMTDPARHLLRQWPMFRLAWYGQPDAPSKNPQPGEPEQENLTGIS